MARVIVFMLATLGWLVLSLACTVLAAAGLLLVTAGLLRGVDAVRRSSLELLVKDERNP